MAHSDQRVGVQARKLKMRASPVPIRPKIPVDDSHNMQSMPECNRRLRRTYLRFIALGVEPDIRSEGGRRLQPFIALLTFVAAAVVRQLLIGNDLSGQCVLDGCYHPVAPHHCRRRRPVLARKLVASRSQRTILPLPRPIYFIDRRTKSRRVNT